jgi:hypothetical protein
MARRADRLIYFRNLNMGSRTNTVPILSSALISRKKYAQTFSSAYFQEVNNVFMFQGLQNAYFSQGCDGKLKRNINK